MKLKALFSKCIKYQQQSSCSLVDLQYPPPPPAAPTPAPNFFKGFITATVCTVRHPASTNLFFLVRDSVGLALLCTFYLSINVFSTKVLIGDTIFYVSNWRRDRHFTWSSEPREGLACCSAKGVPSFLGYFKTLSIGPAPGNERATSREMFNTTFKFYFCSVDIKFAQ